MWSENSLSGAVGFSFQKLHSQNLICDQPAQIRELPEFSEFIRAYNSKPTKLLYYAKNRLMAQRERLVATCQDRLCMTVYTYHTVLARTEFVDSTLLLI